MMNCSTFQDSITDYLDGEMENCVRADFAAHRLRCRPCREVFNDVRAMLTEMQALASEDVLGDTTALESRILAATTAGEMLSCRDFDRLIENYFDGVILAPTFQTFQVHFKSCHKCRRLMAGIDDAIALFTETKEADMAVSSTLHARIMAATTGEDAPGRLLRWQAGMKHLLQQVWTPQWAAASLIFAASLWFVYSNFGGFGGMASEAGTRAERLVVEGNEAVSQTSAMAATGVQFVTVGVSSILRPRRQETRPAGFRTDNYSDRLAEQLLMTPPHKEQQEPDPQKIRGNKNRQSSRADRSRSN